MIQKFELNWKLILIVTIPVCAIVFFLIWEITYPAILSMVFSTSLPISWTWFSIILTDIGFIACGAMMLWGVVSSLFTEITETRIRRRLLRREEIILGEIKQMQIRNFRLEMFDSKHKFTLVLVLYKNPDEVLNFIKDHLTPQEVRSGL